jgi:hypothetical protein
MLMAAYSALQGWHPMQYAYWATSETAPAMINSFEAMFDPTQTNLLPAAALLFARGDVRESPEAFYDPVTRDAATDPLTTVTTHPAVALVGKYGLAFTDLAPVASNPSLLDAARDGAASRTSVTHELSWNAAEGLVTIDTARTQAVVGFAGGRHVATADVAFDVTTPFGVVVVSSLTKEPIASAARLLVSTSGDARWTGTEISPDGERVLTTGHFPFLMQPIEGRLVIKGAAGTVYRLDTDGSRLGTLAVTATADGISVPLAASNKAMHLEIVR